IECQSGAFDQPNIIFSEQYQRTWADGEFNTLARLRGVFSPCLDAIVEHKHWMWGATEKDDTYRLSEPTEDHDHQVFQRRLPELIRLAYEHHRSAWDTLMWLGVDINELTGPIEREVVALRQRVAELEAQNSSFKA